jgi:hypothetical protein
MWTVFVVLGSFYLGGPLLVYFQQRPRKVDDAAQPLSDQEFGVLSLDARSYLDHATSVLQGEGFGPPARAMLRTSSSTVSYLSVLEHRDETTVAVAMAVQVTVKDKHRVRCVLNLRSDFKDGRSIFTSNTKTASAFPRNPRHDGLRFADVTDTVALWRIHQYRVQERARAVPTVRPTVNGDLFGYVKRELGEAYQRWCAIGYFQRTSDGGVRPTILGALLMVWRMLPPWKQLNDQADARAATSYRAA